MVSGQGTPAREAQRAVSAAVVVRAYTERRWDVLLQSLRAAAAQAGEQDEVLLVVDHNDELLERAVAAVPPGVRVVASTGHQGLSGARNSGVAATDRDVVVFLDDDAVPAPGWLDALLAPYVEPGVVGVGGVAQPEWLAARPAWFPEEFLWVVGCTYRGIPDRLHAIRNPIGASMAFRADAAAGGRRLLRGPRPGRHPAPGLRGDRALDQGGGPAPRQPHPPRARLGGPPPRHP